MTRKGEKKAPWFLIRNSAGEPDSMWTLTLVAFIVTTASYVASMFDVIQLGGMSMTFREFDGTSYAAVVLIPLITAYFGRRFTKSQGETALQKAKMYADAARDKVSEQLGWSEQDEA